MNYSPPSNETSPSSEPEIPNIPEMKDEPMKIRTDDGENLEVSYSNKEESISKHKKKKRKTSSEQIHLHVQLCMS